VLGDREFEGFLKLVGVHPPLNPEFRFTTYGESEAAGAGSMPPPPPPLHPQGRPSPSRQRGQQQSQHQPQQQSIPMSPLGGSRLGKRKNTPTKKGSARSSGASPSGRREVGRSPAALKKGSEKDQKAMADEIAEYLKKPDDFEDLINECVG
jgi:hypothetical protein